MTDTAAGMQALLSMWTGQSDFVVQTPFANRERLELQNMVGDVSGEALLRATLTGGPSFSTHVACVHNLLLEARSNSEVPLQLQARALQGAPVVSAVRVRLGMPSGLKATAKEETSGFAGLQTSNVPLNVRLLSSVAFAVLFSVCFQLEWLPLAQYGGVMRFNGVPHTQLLPTHQSM